jgi:hypothetical protein
MWLSRKSARPGRDRTAWSRLPISLAPRVAARALVTGSMASRVGSLARKVASMGRLAASQFESGPLFCLIWVGSFDILYFFPLRTRVFGEMSACLSSGPSMRQENAAAGGIC